MPQGLVYPMAGVLNGKLYVVAGSNNGAVGAMNAYDPVTNAWTPKAAGTARSLGAAGVVDDRLYVVGGCLVGGCGAGNVTNLLEEYDPAANTWATKASMPTARQLPAVAAIDGKLYVVGGSAPCTPNCTPFYDKLEVYDPSTNTWATKAPMPRPLLAVGAAALDGKLYVVGGQVETSPSTSDLVATLYVYDPIANTWDTTRAPLPTARTMALVVAIDGLLHVVGGLVAGGEHLVHHVYDPVSNMWSTRASVSTMHSGGVAGVIDGRPYIAGGYKTEGLAVSDILEVFEP
jgi:N-acetylneuraminic acid mutarotase